jgi:hypothetical protein
MNCTEVEKQIYFLLDDGASSEIREQVKHHLKECQNCKQIYAKLEAVNEVLMKSITVPEPYRMDTNVIEAFRRHQSKKHKAKESANWWAALLELILIPKTAVALFALLFVVSGALAFQFGRMTATNVQAPTSQAEKINQLTFKEKDAPVISTEPASKPMADSHSTKFIKVPVIKEKIVTRIVYVNKPLKRESQRDTSSGTFEKNNLAIKSSMQRNEFLTEVNLKGFQLVSDSKVRIIKKGETNEN